MTDLLVSLVMKMRTCPCSPCQPSCSCSPPPTGAAQERFPLPLGPDSGATILALKTALKLALDTILILWHVQTTHFRTFSSVRNPKPFLKPISKPFLKPKFLHQNRGPDSGAKKSSFINFFKIFFKSFFKNCFGMLWKGDLCSTKIQFLILKEQKRTPKIS